MCVTLSKFNDKVLLLKQRPRRAKTTTKKPHSYPLWNQI